MISTQTTPPHLCNAEASATSLTSPTKPSRNCLFNLFVTIINNQKTWTHSYTFNARSTFSRVTVLNFRMLNWGLGRQILWWAINLHNYPIMVARPYAKAVMTFYGIGPNMRSLNFSFTQMFDHSNCPNKGVRHH